MIDIKHCEIENTIQLYDIGYKMGIWLGYTYILNFIRIIFILEPMRNMFFKSR